MTNPLETSTTDLPSQEQPEPTSVFKDGAWYKLGASTLSRNLGSFGINEIFTVSPEKKDPEQVVLTSIRGEQTTVRRSLLEALENISIHELVPIAIGDKFRIPNISQLAELKIDIPAHIKERIGAGAILKVVGICNGGSMIEVSLKNGSAFLICPEVLSKFKRKGVAR